MEIRITPVQKRAAVRFLVDNLQVIAFEVVENEGGKNGLMFQWMEGANSTSDLEHITYDDGHTYEQVRSDVIAYAVNKHRVSLEENREKLSRLSRIWVEYKKLGQTASSA